MKVTTVGCVIDRQTRQQLFSKQPKDITSCGSLIPLFNRMVLRFNLNLVSSSQFFRTLNYHMVPRDYSLLFLVRLVPHFLAQNQSLCISPSPET